MNKDLDIVIYPRLHGKSYAENELVKKYGYRPISLKEAQKEGLNRKKEIRGIKCLISQGR